MKTCLNWKVLAGLAVVGVGIYVVAPNQVLGLLPLLLLAACPLSMVLMMVFMGKSMTGNQCAQQGQQKTAETGAAPMREERITQLKTQLEMMQAQQAAIAAQVAVLEQGPVAPRPAAPVPAPEGGKNLAQADEGRR